MPIPGKWLLHVIFKDGSDFLKLTQVTTLLKKNIGTLIADNLVIKHIWCSFCWQGSPNSNSFGPVPDQRVVGILHC
jgi:hypothetical protein